jgi:hypothetical protein
MDERGDGLFGLQQSQGRQNLGKGKSQIKEATGATQVVAESRFGIAGQCDAIDMAAISGSLEWEINLGAARF